MLTSTHTHVHARTQPRRGVSTLALNQDCTHPCTHSTTHARIHARTQPRMRASSHALNYACVCPRTHSTTHAHVHARTQPRTHITTNARHQVCAFCAQTRIRPSFRVSHAYAPTLLTTPRCMRKINQVSNTCTYIYNIIYRKSMKHKDSNRRWKYLTTLFTQSGGFHCIVSYRDATWETNKSAGIRRMSMRDKTWASKDDQDRSERLN